MASLVLKMSVSLDGYVAPPDGSTDWVTAGRSDDSLRWTVETVSNAGAHLIGAATYAGWAGYWPGAPGPFAAPMNEIPKVVFSNSLTSADWGETTIATGDLAEAVMRLKRERPDGYLLAHGGVRFARSLVQTGLIDEYRLVIHPAVLGSGRAALPRAAHHQDGKHHRLQRRSRRPRLHDAPVIEPDAVGPGRPLTGEAGCRAPGIPAPVRPGRLRGRP